MAHMTRYGPTLRSTPSLPLTHACLCVSRLQESVSSIDLDQVLADAGQVARVAAAGAAAAAAASGTGEGPEAADRAWRMCLQLAAQGIEKELVGGLAIGWVSGWPGLRSGGEGCPDGG